LYVFGVREGGFGSSTRQPTLLLMTIVSYSEHARKKVYLPMEPSFRGDTHSAVR